MKAAGRRYRIRPARPLSPLLVSVLVLLVWWGVAHSSGSGWVQVLGDAVFGMLLVGLFGPAIALRRNRVRIVHSPFDASAGLPAVVAISATGPARVRPVEPQGPDSLIGKRPAGTDQEVVLVPVHRGVHDEIVIDLATAAPFGLQWWTRRVVLDFPTPLHVAPRLGNAIQLPYWLDDFTGTAGTSNPSEAGDARGVRDYRPGDRRRRVHWGATAHAGRLMVREMEDPSAQPITLKVSLPGDPEAAERMAEQALATAVKLLDRGVHIVLATSEGGGEVVESVADRREVGRRLARATGGPSGARMELVR